MSRAFCSRRVCDVRPPTCRPMQYGKQFWTSDKQEYVDVNAPHMGCIYSIASAAELCTCLAPLEPNALKASSKLVSMPRLLLLENRFRENRRDMTFTIVHLHCMPCVLAGELNTTWCVVWCAYSSSLSYRLAKKGTLLQTTAIERMSLATSSTHAQPKRPVRVSPTLSASCISPYLTAATPNVVSMRNGNVETDHAVLPPSVVEW